MRTLYIRCQACRKRLIQLEQWGVGIDDAKDGIKNPGPALCLNGACSKYRQPVTPVKR